jgi:hypothetical protein
MSTINHNDFASNMLLKCHNSGAGGIMVLKCTPVLNCVENPENKRAWQKLHRMCRAAGLIWNDEGERN